MNKQTVELAEQVGLFLIPVFREMAKSIFADVSGAFMERVAALAADVQKSRDDLAASNAKAASELESIRSALAGVDKSVKVFEDGTNSRLNDLSQAADRVALLSKSFEEQGQAITKITGVVEAGLAAIRQQHDEAHRAAVATSEALARDLKSLSFAVEENAAAIEGVQQSTASIKEEVSAATESVRKDLIERVTSVASSQARDAEAILGKFKDVNQMLDSTIMVSNERYDEVNKELRTLRDRDDELGITIQRSYDTVERSIGELPAAVSEARVNEIVLSSVEAASKELILRVEQVSAGVADQISKAMDAALKDLPPPPAPQPVDTHEIAAAAAKLVPVPEAPPAPDVEEIARSAAAFVRAPEIDVARIAGEAAKLVPVPSEPDLDEIATRAAKLVPVPEPTVVTNVVELDPAKLDAAAEESVRKAMSGLDIGLREELAKQVDLTVSMKMPNVAAMVNDTANEVIETRLAEELAARDPLTAAQITDTVKSVAGSLVAEKIGALEIQKPVDEDKLYERVFTQAKDFINGLATDVEASVDSKIVASVSKAVAEIKLPEPKEVDVNLVRETIEDVVSNSLDETLPRVRESLAANVKDEVSRAVSALPKAKDGKDGEVGLMPVAQPYVEGRIYERGEGALHAGGLWQATRATKTPPAPDTPDWQALTVGVAGIEVEPADDLRTVTFTASLTDGSAIKHAVSVPALVYRDVYDEGATYSAHDVVTFAGSMWVARKTTTGSKPSASPDDWKLAVKRGQNGINGKDAPAPEPVGVSYAGEYELNKVYRKDSLVGVNGSLWLSKRPTKDIPPYAAAIDENDHWIRVR